MPDVKFSNQYPYTDFHELNLDWVIKEVKYWSERVGKSIQKIELTGTVGLVDTYTITYSDGSTSTFDVTNGNGIASVAKTGTAGLVDTYTITFQDGSTSTFEVTNGAAAVDPTLSLSDYAADAKVTGDAITKIDDVIFYDDPSTLVSHYIRNSYLNNGSLSNSSSWITYVYHPDEINIESIDATLYTNNATFGLVGFYSSYVPENATLISYIQATGSGANTFHISNFPAGTKAIILCNRNSSGPASVTVHCQILGLEDNAVKSGMINRGEYPYFGRHITLTRNKLNTTPFSPYAITTQSGSPQAAVVQFPYVFVLGSGGYINVLDFSTALPQSVGQFSIGTIDGEIPHANVAFWGNQKYNAGDDFPVLFLNAYQTTLPNGTLYGYRVQMTNVGGVITFTFTHVQTISVGFTSDPVWYDAADSRPFGNFVLDTDHNILYAYVLRDTLNLTRFFAFNMPDISISTATLASTDVLTQFDTEYLNIIQDNCYDGGNIYIAHGTTNRGKIECVSLVEQKRVSTIDVPLLNDNKEPETCTIYNNKMLAGNGTMYWIDFTV